MALSSTHAPFKLLSPRLSIISVSTLPSSATCETTDTVCTSLWWCRLGWLCAWCGDGGGLSLCSACTTPMHTASYASSPWPAHADIHNPCSSPLACAALRQSNRTTHAMRFDPWQLRGWLPSVSTLLVPPAALSHNTLDTAKLKLCMWPLHSSFKSSDTTRPPTHAHAHTVSTFFRPTSLATPRSLSLVTSFTDLATYEILLMAMQCMQQALKSTALCPIRLSCAFNP
jgi:hypothetical protein